jgi:TPR repeat protein
VRSSLTVKLAFKHAIAATLLMLSLAAQVASERLKDANAAYGRGDFPTTMRLLRPLAQQGNAVAQYILGWMYDDKSEGVPLEAVTTDLVSPSA